MTTRRDERGPEDLVGADHWDSTWGQVSLPRPIDVHGRVPAAYQRRRVHAFLVDALADVPAGGRAVELGCAASPWLPYLANEHGLEVAGIDYSATGCSRARAALGAADVEGTVIEADLFDPPAKLLGAHDLAISFGVAEHFADTAAFAAAAAALVTPGGTVVTIVPNLDGVNGSIMRRLNPPAWDRHVLLTPDDLAAAHADAGLHVTVSRYLVELPNLALTNVVNAEGLSHIGIRRAAFSMLRIATGALWALAPVLPARPSRTWSPFVGCVARKPER